MRNKKLTPANCFTSPLVKFNLIYKHPKQKPQKNEIIEKPAKSSIPQRKQYQRTEKRKKP